MRPLHLIALAFLLALLCGAWPLFGLRDDRITGSVHSEHGPLAGARVRYQGTNELTFSDAHGRFWLPRRADAPRVTASKAGYLIGGQPASARPLALRLRALPEEDNEDYAWIAPGHEPRDNMNCVNCHDEIYREWQGSSHARSTTGKFFLDLYAGTDWHGKPGVGWSLLDQNPEGSGVCSACHAPTATGEAVFDVRQAQGVDANGVHCDLCHKIAEVNTAKVGLTHGRFGLELLRPKLGQMFFGPLDDVDRDEDAFAPVYRESRYCASCHEGVVFGVHAYSTYSEWLESPARRAGKQCQTCHLTPTGTMTNIAPGKGGVPRDPGTLASHHMPGGTLEMLRRAVQFESRVDGPRVHVQVRATDVGHRVPTGFIDRHLILIVEGYAADGRKLTARAGPVLPPIVGPELAGWSGQLFAKRLQAGDDESAVPFWQAAHARLSDTRLTPGRLEQSTYDFGAELARVRTRLLYRRFWDEVRRAKDWPRRDVIVHDEQRSSASSAR